MPKLKNPQAKAISGTQWLIDEDSKNENESISVDETRIQETRLPLDEDLIQSSHELDDSYAPSQSWNEDRTLEPRRSERLRNRPGGML